MAVSKRPGETRWRAVYLGPDGRQVTKRFDRRVDAVNWEAAQRTSMLTGKHVAPRAGRITVKRCGTEWLALQFGRDSTLSLIDNALRLHLFPVYGTYAMVSVHRTHIQRLVKTMEDEGYAPRTIRTVYDNIARFFADQVENHVIPESPCRKITLPEVLNVEVEAPSPEDVAAIVRAMVGDHKVLILLLCATGLRIGEALGLQRRDVDFIRKTITVDPLFGQRRQDGTLGPPKTKTSARTVQVSHALLDALVPLVADLAPDGLLWTVPYSTWKQTWRRAMKTAGLEDRGLTSHDLRHYVASALISRGSSVKQVQLVLGHANAVITLRTYAHRFPGDEERTRLALVEALDDVLDCVDNPNENDAALENVVKTLSAGPA